MKLKEYCKFSYEGFILPQELKQKPLGSTYFFDLFDESKVNITGIENYFINSQSISKGYIETVYLFDYSRKFYSYILKKKNIIISKIPPYSHTIFDNGFPFQNNPQCIMEQKILAGEGIFVIELLENLIDPYYIYYLLSTDEIRKYLGDAAENRKNKYLSLDDVLNIEIPEYNDTMKNNSIEYKNKIIREAFSFQRYVNRPAENNLSKSFNDTVINTMNKMFSYFTPRQKEFFDLTSKTKVDGTKYTHKEASEILHFSEEEYYDYISALHNAANYIFNNVHIEMSDSYIEKWDKRKGKK